MEQQETVARAYEFNSVPLRRVVRPKVGQLIYTSYGEGFICEKENPGYFTFTKVHDSVLNSGVLVEDLSREVLEYLFWPLTRTELKNANYAVTSTS